MENVEIRLAEAPEIERRSGELAEILIDCVDGGASVSFLPPLAASEAEAFWRGVGRGVAAGDRVLIVAERAAAWVGTVQVLLAMPPNQPHRGELAKMLVHRSARRRGIGARLLARAEKVALERGKTLLVLDTWRGGDAERLYRRAGWQRVGVIPGFALLADGSFGDTVIFYKNPSTAAAEERR
jgi:GNAT superfamily N-acetyltransferase